MKKLLALVLALVMSMSLVTISNADFKDADDIDYAKAVEVMNAVGVIAGYDNGNFGAKDTLTRAQACKIIAYLDLGEKVAEALPAIQVFSDVPASNWAAKYIAYCADAGYVSGVGDNKFAPDEKVTGYQFAKMLLCVLGYDASIEQMTGVNWQIAIAKLMEKNDINDGVDGYASAALTREEAAQYALNALLATCVDYENKGTDINLGSAGTITVAASKAAKVEADGDDYAEALGNEDTIELGEKLYKGDLEITDDVDTDAYGRPADQWKYDGKEIGVYAASAKKVYTGKLTGATLLKDFSLDDGETVAITTASDAGFTSSTETIADKYDTDTIIGAVGTVTEVFTTDGEITKIVNIPYYLGEVTDVTEADEDDEDSVREIEIEDSYTYETESFEEDDIVVYTLGWDEEESEVIVVTVAEAEAVAGKVTAIKSSKYTVSGTQYTKMATVGGDGAPSVGDEGTIYLNVDGSFGWFDEKSGSTGNFALIYSIVIDDSTRDEDGNEEESYIAYYVDADGVKAKAKLAMDDDDKVLGGQDTTDLDELRRMYEYELTDDGFEAVDNANIDYTSDDLANVKIDTGAYADSKTVFVFVYNKDAAAGTALDVEDGKVVTKVVTGIKNVEKYDADKYLFYVTKDETVTYAFVCAAPADAESDATYGILLDDTAEVTKSDDGKTTYYTYEVMLDGKKDTLTVKNSSTKFSSESVGEGDAFEYTLVDNYVSNVTKVTGDVTGDVEKVVGSDIVIGSDVYTLADDVTVYVVKELNNGDLKVTLGSIKADDSIYAVQNDDDELKFVVVDNR